jgi:hypothetical protein
MALMKCKECGHDVSTQAKVCPTCGAQIKKPSGTGLALFLLVVIGVLALIGLATRDRSVSDQQTVPAPQRPSPSPTPDPFTTMTPTEHVAEIKKALEAWTPHKDPMKTYWGRLDDADRHYAILPAEDQRRPDVVKLKAELERRKKESSRLAGIATREVFARQLEKNYLDQGLDVYVSLHGQDNTTLKLKFVLFSRPLVHKFTNDAGAMAALRKAGFKKVILTDGYNQTWTLDL